MRQGEHLAGGSVPPHGRGADLLVWLASVELRRGPLKALHKHINIGVHILMDIFRSYYQQDSLMNIRKDVGVDFHAKLSKYKNSSTTNG